MAKGEQQNSNNLANQTDMSNMSDMLTTLLDNLQQLLMSAAFELYNYMCPNIKTSILS